jgi:hypothetical protein
MNEAYVKFRNPSEHLAVVKVTTIFKGRVIFRQYSPKKIQYMGLDIYKPYDEPGYTYGMRVCLEVPRSATDDIATTRNCQTFDVQS